MRYTRCRCATEITPFQFWFGQTILPFVFGLLMGSVLVVVTVIFWVMQHTRLPIWARRKFSKRLRPPRLQVATDADSLVNPLHPLHPLHPYTHYTHYTRYTRYIRYIHFTRHRSQRTRTLSATA